ncbi:MAG: response regulator, partial [Verrucomicrobiae bacterium]|nr:response regulator [Verrucomicrobiae bacterium]
DLVLADFSMPAFDGLSALKMVREFRTDLPVIFVSGSIGEDMAIEALRKGATDYVLKERLSRLIPAVQRAMREVEDRAARRNMQERLRRKAALLDCAQDAMFVVDPALRIKLWNKRAHVLHGVAPEQAIGCLLTDVIQIEELNFLETALAQVHESGHWEGEIHQRHGDLRAIVASRWIRVDDPESDPAIFVVESDITEKKRLEAQFLRAQRMESIGKLAGGISHDLNNVLTPILMAVEILQGHIQDSRLRKILATMETSAKRGADLVKQVLQFVRGVDHKHSAISPRQLLTEMERIARQTFPKSIEIECRLPAELWNLSGDSTQLHQVLLNLLVNARDAMPEGGRLILAAKNIELEGTGVSEPQGARPGPYVELSISDTGPGIPDEIKERIFEPFFTTKGTGEGTGLGLFTVAGIVKNHGGAIRVESGAETEIGRGTTFRVYLSALKEGEALAAHSRPKDLPGGRGELVLVVDDEASIREITQATLQTYGYRVVTATDGACALKVFEKRRAEIQAALVDMEMPGLAGSDTMRQLRQLEPKVKLIAMSGSVDIEQMINKALIERHAFLTKPYTAEKLLKTLDVLLHAAKV